MTISLNMPPLALVSLEEASVRDFAVAELQGMGYEVHPFSGECDPALQLHSHSYRVVVLSPCGIASGALLTELASLPMDRRRELYVVLLGDGVESRSPMAAFVQSVDLTLSLDDLAYFRTLVERGIAEQDRFYSVLKQVQQAVRAG